MNKFKDLASIGNHLVLGISSLPSRGIKGHTCPVFTCALEANDGPDTYVARVLLTEQLCSLYSTYFILFIYFSCMNALPACMYVYYMCAWCQWKSEEGIRFPRPRVTGCCELPYRY